MKTCPKVSNPVNLGNNELRWNFTVIDCFASVSYTHLDVYKRQRQERAALSFRNFDRRCAIPEKFRDTAEADINPTCVGLRANLHFLDVHPSPAFAVESQDDPSRFHLGG